MRFWGRQGGAVNSGSLLAASFRRLWALPVTITAAGPSGRRPHHPPPPRRASGAYHRCRNKSATTATRSPRVESPGRSGSPALVAACAYHFAYRGLCLAFCTLIRGNDAPNRLYRGSGGTLMHACAHARACGLSCRWRYTRYIRDFLFSTSLRNRGSSPNGMPEGRTSVARDDRIGGTSAASQSSRTCSLNWVFSQCSAYLRSF